MPASSWKLAGMGLVALNYLREQRGKTTVTVGEYLGAILAESLSKNAVEIHEAYELTCGAIALSGAADRFGDAVATTIAAHANYPFSNFSRAARADGIRSSRSSRRRLVFPVGTGSAYPLPGVPRRPKPAKRGDGGAAAALGVGAVSAGGHERGGTGAFEQSYGRARAAFFEALVTAAFARASIRAIRELGRGVWRGSGDAMGAARDEWGARAASAGSPGGAASGPDVLVAEASVDGLAELVGVSSWAHAGAPANGGLAVGEHEALEALTRAAENPAGGAHGFADRACDAAA